MMAGVPTFVFILVYKDVAQVKRCPRVQSLGLPEIAVIRAEMFKLHCAVKFYRVQFGFGRTCNTVSLLRFS